MPSKIKAVDIATEAETTQPEEIEEPKDDSIVEIPKPIIVEVPDEAEQPTEPILEEVKTKTKKEPKMITCPNCLKTMLFVNGVALSETLHTTFVGIRVAPKSR